MQFHKKSYICLSTNQRMFQFSRFLLILGIYFFCFNDGFTQITQSDRDSLELLVGQKNWEEFNKKLRRVGFSIPKEKFAGKEKAELLSWIVYLHKQKPERKYFRDAYMHFAGIITKMEGHESANQYLLLANSYVEDPFCLDKKARFIENKLASNYNRLDDLEKSEYFHGLVENALVYWGDSSNLSRTYTNLGILKFTSNRIKDAEQDFITGLRIASQVNFAQGMFANSTGLGSLYLELDSFKLAKRFQNLAFEYLYKTPETNLEENKLNWNWTQAKYFAKLGNVEDARCYFNTALEYYNSNPYDRECAKICKDIASMYLDREDLKQSNEFLVKGIRCFLPNFNSLDSIPTRNQLFQENTFADLFLVASEWYDLRYRFEQEFGLLKKSVAYLELGLFGYEIIQGSILLDPSKLKIIGSNRALVDRGIERLFQLCRTEGNSPDLILKVRQFFNYSKALLLETKNEEILAIRKFSKKDKEIFKDLEKQEYKLIHLKPTDRFEKNFVLGERLKIRQKKSDLFDKYPIKVQILQYPDNYIEYQIIQDTVYILAMLNGESYFEQIGTNEELQKIIKGINADFDCRELGPDENLLKQAYNFLFGFVKKPLPKRFCVIPDGQIQFVPFDALIHPDGLYMLNHCSIYFAQRYGEPEFEPDFSEKPKFILAIRPEYPETGQQNLIASRGNVSALLYTQEEVEGIHKLFGSRVDIQKKITVDELPEYMQSAEIVHFAGHAKAEKDAAYLIFPGERSHFGLSQLASLHSPWRMVVLSACETGLGEWEYGEGIRSLGKSFQEAGAQSVIMSLWSVNDEFSAKIMIGFYKELKEGKSKDEALRNAKLEYLNQAGFEKKHPYYWAGFVGYGDMEGIVKSSSVLKYLLVGFLICILFYFFKKYRYVF
ncbi:MAG: CHAT domain-containing protein [Saprospiraceae bacterium]|nr:CHAT domain-containing protein [Saprospiraceae bacterium]